MTAFLVEPAPAIALAVHRSTDLGTPEHEVGQRVIEHEIRLATNDYARERRGREGER